MNDNNTIHNETFMLPDCTILITGSSSGIGLALVREAIASRATVIAHCRSQKKMESAIQDIHCSKLNIVVGDLLTVKGRKRLENVVSQSKPNIMILNAGYLSRKAYTSEWTDDEINEMLAVNLISPIECARTFSKNETATPNRRLAFILSTSCKHIRPKLGLYIACKTGLMGFAQTMQQEISKIGIRTTLFYPGRTNTNIRQTKHEEYMSPESVAKAIFKVLTLPDDLVPFEFTFRPPIDTVI